MSGGAPSPRKRRTLFRRIYAYGLMQIAAMAVAVVLYNVSVNSLAVPEVRMALYRPDGTRVAETGESPPGPPSETEMRGAPMRMSRPPPRLATVKLLTPDGTPLFARVGVPPPFGPTPLRLFGVLGAVLLAVALVSYFAARALARPVERLTAKVRAVAAGDMRVRAATGDAGPGEVGELAAAFDEMVERIDRALRRERELLANISHELRTPLSRIRVALELAAESEPARAKEHLEGVSGDLAELERLVDGVLSAARLDSTATGDEPLPLRKAPIAAALVLADAAEHFRQAHPGRELHSALEEPLPILDGDRVMLRRALDNVLHNAAKYSDQPVALRAFLGDGGLRVEIADRGIGISAEELPKLFTPFLRLDQSRTRATGGVGLGLVLAKRIVEGHGGRIAVQSTPGEGTMVTIVLPAASSGQPR